MSAVDDNGVLRYRVDSHGKQLVELMGWRREVDEERVEQRAAVRTMHEDMTELAKAVDGLRKVLLGFALSVAGSAVVFALTTLVATGRL